MTIRHTIAAAAVSAVALMSGAGMAADFASQLSEARIASQSAGRDIRDVVTPALNAARSLNAEGSQDKAQDYLNFARGKLGLSTSQVPGSQVMMASPVVASPEPKTEATGSFAERLTEAKIASHAAGRATLEAVTPALNAAQSLNDRGSRDEAQDYLNFARRKLGLPGNPVVVAAPVIAVPAGAGQADSGGIIGLRDERS